jgi:hypothetical protein
MSRASLRLAGIAAKISQHDQTRVAAGAAELPTCREWWVAVVGVAREPGSECGKGGSVGSDGMVISGMWLSTQKFWTVVES